jgi:anti-anti-sigma regulatory factor
MLRITTKLDDGYPAVLKLEGKLLEPWINELVEACRRAVGDDQSAVIDLSGVSFVDAPAAVAVRELMRRGIGLTGCSPLVARLLEASD